MTLYISITIHNNWSTSQVSPFIILPFLTFELHYFQFLIDFTPIFLLTLSILFLSFCLWKFPKPQNHKGYPKLSTRFCMVPTNIKNKSVGYKGGIQCTTQKRKLWVKQVLTLDFEKQMLNALIMD